MLYPRGRLTHMSTGRSAVLQAALLTVLSHAWQCQPMIWHFRYAPRLSWKQSFSLSTSTQRHVLRAPTQLGANSSAPMVDRDHRR